MIVCINALHGGQPLDEPEQTVSGGGRKTPYTSPYFQKNLELFRKVRNVTKILGWAYMYRMADGLRVLEVEVRREPGRDAGIKIRKGPWVRVGT